MDTNTLERLVNEALELNAEAVAAVKGLATERPWRGAFDRRVEAFIQCNRELNEALPHDGHTWQLVHIGARTGDSGRSRIDPKLRRIVLAGHLSVVTFLYLFARTRDLPRAAAMVWAVTMFKKCFPRSFARCEFVGGMVVNSGRRND